MTTPTPAAIEALFREWWAMSYPTPPGVHAINTHTGFGAWLLEQFPAAGAQCESEPEPTESR